MNRCEYCGRPFWENGLCKECGAAVMVPLISLLTKPDKVEVYRLLTDNSTVSIEGLTQVTEEWIC